MKIMVHISAKALRTHDEELAKTEEEDKLYTKYLHKLEEAIPTTKCLLSNVLIVRYLERIADHAAHMGESIVYIATGEKISLR